LFTKFPALTVRGVILVKLAERLTPAEKNKTAAKGSKIANHALSHEHSIDFNNASLVDKGSFRIRKTLESWHTMVTPNTINNSCPLPGQYNILFTHIHN